MNGTRSSTGLLQVVTDPPEALDGRAPLVAVIQWAYRVDFGPGVRPQYHTVSKLKRCHCPLGADCPAVIAVSEYLKSGGERAADPPFDVWPWVPDPCPICGSHSEAEPGLDSANHGLGWRCARTGSWCYWAARTVPLIVGAAQRQAALRLTPVMALTQAVALARTWLPMTGRAGVPAATPLQPAD
jgi:hypothetical protein